jgi:hypothetical protein
MCASASRARNAPKYGLLSRSRDSRLKSLVEVAMNHVSESLDWSYMSLFGAALGYLLHLTMSWAEWRKISKQPDMSLWAFIAGDPASQATGVIIVVALYCSLSALSQWDGIKDIVGFVPRVDFIGAFMTAFTSQGFGVKLANIYRRVSGP